MSFDFDFTASKLEKALPGIKNSKDWMESINKLFPYYEITTKKRVAMFLAQTGHESGNWTKLEENLNYRASTLLKVFPKYFKTQAEADRFAMQPEKIANRVYSNRMGNGDERSGDGYRYRGRGILQITGKDNYRACSKSLYGDERLLTKPELLTTNNGALGSACWYWKMRGLNVDSDRRDTVSATKKINGGTNGLEDRTIRYNHIMKIL